MVDKAPSPRPFPTRLVVVLVLVGLVLWFAFANRDTVEVNFLVGKRDSRLIYVILGSALLGAIAGALMRRIRHRDRGRD